jgi:DNA-binding PadR family transcriptional regulator
MDVKTLCLGVLSRGESTGYEIRKQFEEGPFAHFQDAGFGSIYPALKRLTDEGLVQYIEQPQDGRPDRKVYRITSKGRQALYDAVNRPPTEDKFRSDFLFILCFADLVSPADLDRMIDARIAEHRRMLEQLDCGGQIDGPEGLDFVRRYGCAIHRTAITFLEDHRHELLGSLFHRDVAE